MTLLFQFNNPIFLSLKSKELTSIKATKTQTTFYEFSNTTKQENINVESQSCFSISSNGYLSNSAGLFVWDVGSIFENQKSKSGDYNLYIDNVKTTLGDVTITKNL